MLIIDWKAIGLVHKLTKTPSSTAPEFKSYCTLSCIYTMGLENTYNPDKDIPDLSGKVIFMTGGISYLYKCSRATSADSQRRNCWSRQRNNHHTSKAQTAAHRLHWSQCKGRRRRHQRHQSRQPDGQGDIHRMRPDLSCIRSIGGKAVPRARESTGRLHRQRRSHGRRSRRLQGRI